MFTELCRKSRFLGVCLVFITTLLAFFICYADTDPCNEGIIDPEILFHARAIYIKKAKLAEIEGTVSVRVIVGVDGRVKESSIIEGVHPFLNSSAIDACKLCRFEPGRENCMPVESQAIVMFPFYLKDIKEGKKIDQIEQLEVIEKLEKGTQFSEEAPNPTITYWAKPEYPEMARMEKIEGTVILKVLVGIDGIPIEIVVSQGVHPLLNRAAIDAAERCKFIPGKKRNEPVEAWTGLPFAFTLN